MDKSSPSPAPAAGETAPALDKPPASEGKPRQTQITNFFSSPVKVKGKTQKEEGPSSKENHSPKFSFKIDKKRKADHKDKDYERDELLDRRERPLAPSKNPKIRSERIDNIIRGRKRDTEHYRRGYPGKVDSQSSNENVLFYKNQLSSCPEGDYIDNIHKKWWGNYRKLEVHHGYIQWLFPLREAGMNYQAKELQLHEAETIRSTPECSKRVLTSYKMMLDFYGLLMVNDETGELERASNWKERFKHLNRSYHNYLRITRILKSLGELGFEHIKSKFVELMLKEIIQEGTLPNLFESCVGYWIMVLKDDQEREQLIQLAKTLCDQYNGVSDVNKEPEERAEDEVHLEKPPNDENIAVNNNGTLATDDKAASKI